MLRISEVIAEPHWSDDRDPAIEARDEAEFTKWLNKKYVAEATAIIREAVCEHMPTTAAANGMIPPMPTRSDAAPLIDQFAATGLEPRVSIIAGWLATLDGLPASSFGTLHRRMARAIREEIIRRDLVRGTR